MPIKSADSTLAGSWSSGKATTSVAVVKPDYVQILIQYSLRRCRDKCWQALLCQAQDLGIVG
jgi:hypothetical protein